MLIIFSLSPINRAIENHLPRQVTRKRKQGAADAANAAVPVSA